MDIRTRLGLFMSAASVSSKTVARATDLAESTVRKWLKEDGSEPGASSLTQLHHLGLSVQWLLFDEGSMFSDTPKGRELMATARRESIEEAGGSEDVVNAGRVETESPTTAEGVLREIEAVLERYRAQELSTGGGG